MSDHLYVECGCCGSYHKPGFTGDCRDDANRFTPEQMEAEHGPDVWDRVLDLETQMSKDEEEGFMEWTVTFRVHKSWVADGFILTSDRAKRVLASDLSGAYDWEIDATVTAKPDDDAVAKLQGYMDAAQAKARGEWPDDYDLPGQDRESYSDTQDRESYSVGED